MNGVVKKAVVLTAGMGLRSLPATKAVPKAMLAVLDKPAVQWVCEEAAQSGAREILRYSVSFSPQCSPWRRAPRASIRPRDGSPCSEARGRRCRCR